MFFCYIKSNKLYIWIFCNNSQAFHLPLKIGRKIFPSFLNYKIFNYSLTQVTEIVSVCELFEAVIVTGVAEASTPSSLTSVFEILVALTTVASPEVKVVSEVAFVGVIAILTTFSAPSSSSNEDSPKNSTFVALTSGSAVA